MSLNLKDLTDEQKDELVLEVLSQLTFTAQEHFTRDTVLSVGLVTKLIEITIKRMRGEPAEPVTLVLPEVTRFIESTKQIEELAKFNNPQ